MAEDEDIEGKGFVVRDKRSSAKTDEEVAREERRREAQQEEEHTARQEGERRGVEDHPPIDLSTFILSLSTQAMCDFGEIPNPVTQKREKNLAAAKRTIDLISLLQEKTRGNLEEHESKLIENVLYELRMRYVAEIERAPPS